MVLASLGIKGIEMPHLTIIGGSLRSRALKSPKGDKTRPTTAIVRKAVFDMLAPEIEEAHFLDLFAGSGAMGIEALSRGASYATFVESGKEALYCIRNNLTALKLEGQSTILSYDVQKALETLKKKNAQFEIIYCDPPYALASIHREILAFLGENPLLIKGGTLFLEEASPSFLDVKQITLKRLVHKDSRRFGKSLLHRYHAI
jgi:16S rRNA (guanine966-N2)-methyltransferase